MTIPLLLVRRFLPTFVDLSLLPQSLIQSCCDFPFCDEMSGRDLSPMFSALLAKVPQISFQRMNESERAHLTKPSGLKEVYKDVSHSSLRTSGQQCAQTETRARLRNHTRPGAFNVTIIDAGMGTDCT